MIWADLGRGRVFSGERDAIYRPKYYRPEKKPAVLYIHGAEATGGAVDWMGIPTRWPLFRALVRAGYTVLSADLGGSRTWGNDTVISRITSLYDLSQTLPDILPGRVLMVGQSMGNLNQTVWAAANKNKVISLVGIIPVIDVNDIHTIDAGSSAVIDEAYGGTYVEATQGINHNPMTMATAGKLSDIRMQMWYGDTDTLCRPQRAVAFGQQSGAEMHAISGGHAESTVSNVDLAAVLEFMKASIVA